MVMLGSQCFRESMFAIYSNTRAGIFCLCREVYFGTVICRKDECLGPLVLKAKSITFSNGVLERFGNQ